MSTATYPPPNASATPLVPALRTVLVADLVESTALFARLGDGPAASLLQRLELYLRELLRDTGGQLIDRADGALALFERPVQAVDFALRYQRELARLGAEFGAPDLQARIGIHVGEVMTWANDPRAVAAGAKPLEVEGLAKPVAARLMALALPGQILMSGMAQTLAQRAIGELGERGERLRWLLHGRYRFKGVPAPMLVHEVGEPELSPLRAPPSGQKVWREQPLWRRPPVLAAELLLAGGIAAASLYGTFKSEPALAFNQRDWVVMGDLKNLTDQKRLTDPLETALRIGLQQSKYVNVISDARVVETLQRMGRDVDTPVDRALAAEIAAREGARAVVLPTLTDVGGRLRISLELVDPVTQATVYSDDAASPDADGVLDAADDVLERLRSQLGESVASIAKTNTPLEQATTANLDAFRAYTLGQQAKNQSRFGDAIALQEKAIQLDPDFALAYIALASLKFVQGDDGAAYDNLQKAIAHRDRLSLRENLYLDAASQLYAPLAPMLERWKLVAAMYPDEYRAHYNYAFFSVQYGFDYAGALDFMQPALSTQNPARPSAEYLRGTLLLALDRNAAALLAFKQADSLGVGGDKGSFAGAYAVSRHFAEADAVLETQPKTGAPASDLTLQQIYATLAVDQGRWDDAIKQLQGLAQQAAPVSRDLQFRFSGSALMLRSFAPDAGFGRDVAKYLEECTREFEAAGRSRRHDLAYSLIAVSVFAARQGHEAAAEKALATVRPFVAEAKRPILDGMLTVADAELDLAHGRAGSAVDRLEAAIARHEAPYMAHAVLLRALVATGAVDRAADEADWLASHRGLAYGELGNNFMAQAANVAESDLALLSAAELYGSAGDEKTAEKKRAAFRAVWPGPEAAAVESERARYLASGSKRSG
jgi:putative peptide modification system cyclase